MFQSQSEPSNRCYSIEDPLSIPQFDSTMIDLSNPSEIFQFEKADVSCVGASSYDMLAQTSHSYPDPLSYNQSPLSSYDLNLKPRLELTSYAQWAVCVHLHFCFFVCLLFIVTSLNPNVAFLVIPKPKRNKLIEFKRFKFLRKLLVT